MNGTTAERLAWAKEFDCIAKFKEWILDFDKKTGKTIATESELDEIQASAKAGKGGKE